MRSWCCGCLALAVLLLASGCETPPEPGGVGNTDPNSSGSATQSATTCSAQPGSQSANDLKPAADFMIGALQDNHKTSSDVNSELLVKIAQAATTSGQTNATTGAQGGVGFLHFNPTNWDQIAETASGESDIKEGFTPVGQIKRPAPCNPEDALMLAADALINSEQGGQDLCGAARYVFVEAIATAVVPNCQPSGSTANGAGQASPTAGCTSPAPGGPAAAAPVAAVNSKLTLGETFTPETCLTRPSGLTAEQITAFLKKKGASLALTQAASAFIQAEQSSGVNAQYLVAHACEESTCGNSQIAKEKNNYFGYGAADSCPGTCSGQFANATAAILFEAQYVKRDYLTPGGQFFNGPTLAGMNKKYASDQGWAGKIAAIANDLGSSAGKAAAAA
ncbi:MAG: glucosaminidase domain-containing protein [Candidatus Dormibacteraceae bacterium]